ncbi:MAG TPA: glycine betaine ABC transporter substrate-binding protein [Nitrospiraceae bacterium]|nr:glycine betaine ABC transporter substrate-binding protein [Nitrospiraceae bacterium]
MGRAKVFAGFIILIAAGWLNACDREHPITVGSKNFTEQVILGEIVAQHLEHRLSRRVDRKFNLGGTLLAHQALIKGDIDLYPEYVGTALTAVLKLPATSDPAGMWELVRSNYQRQFGIQWIDPLGYNNTFAMVIRGEDARNHGIASLSQAAQYAPGWAMGMGYEFQQRPDGLAGLMKIYHLPLKGSPVTLDLGLLYQALERKQVDMVAGNATDGKLAVLDVAVLADDQHYFPSYQAALAVRDAALQSEPRLQQAVAELSGKFSDVTMRRLNHQVDGEHRPVREVAERFLRDMKMIE